MLIERAPNLLETGNRKLKRPAGQDRISPDYRNQAILYVCMPMVEYQVNEMSLVVV